MEEREVIAMVVEENSKGMPLGILFIDPAVACVTYKRALGVETLQPGDDGLIHVIPFIATVCLN